MLHRSDLLELTRRMNVSRSSLDRVAGCYFDADGEFDGSFNIHFLKLTPEERSRMLQLVKAIPFAETNRQLREYPFPGETRESGDMMRMLDTLKETGLKNDAMVETFCEILAERLAAENPAERLAAEKPVDRLAAEKPTERLAAEKPAERLAAEKPAGHATFRGAFGVYLAHGVYDIPRIGTDKAEQWESEDVYEYLICAAAPIAGDYQPGEPETGFLYPSFKDREPDWFSIAVYEREPGASGRGLLELLGCGE